MRKILLHPLLLITIITLFFFYPIFKGQIPFPGDFLAGGYQPYKSYSHLGYAPGGVPHKAQGFDVIRMLYPFKWFSIEQVKKLQFPLWNPYTLSGNVHAANLQSAVYYPLNALFLLFPFSFGWTTFIILQPIFAAFFLYLYLKEIGLRKEPALFGGIVFAFSAFMTVWLQYGNLGHTLLWLPLILYILQRYQKKPSAALFFILILILTIVILAGYIQLAIYVFAFASVYIFWLFMIADNSINIKKYLPFVLAFFAAPLLAAVQLLPSIEIFSLSARGAYTLTQITEKLIPLQNLVTIIFPDFFGNPATRSYWLSGTYIERASYIGVVPLLFALYAVLKRTGQVTKLFIITALFTYISTLQIFPVQLMHGAGIPFLSTTVPSRILSVFCFALAVLSGIGFNSWLKEKDKRYIFYPIILLGGLIALIWLFVIVQSDPKFLIAKRNMILPTFFFIAAGGVFFLHRFVSQKLIILALFLLTIADLFYFFHKITPFSPVDFLYPRTEVSQKLREIQGVNRSWGYGSAFIEANLSIMEGTYSTDGYDPLFSRRYAELISAGENGRIAKEVKRSDVNIPPGYGADGMRNNLYRQKLLNILGVKYILHAENSKNADYQTFPQNIYKLRWQHDGLQLYENTQSLPRAYLVGAYRVNQEKQKIIDTLFSDSFDARNTVLLEERPTELNDFSNDKLAQVQITKYSPNKVIIHTNAKTNTLLFLSDTFFPGWKVSIDEKNGKIYRANYTFRAVPVAAGEHEVVFSYAPFLFSLGLSISFVTSLVLLGIYLGIYAVKRHKKA